MQFFPTVLKCSKIAGANNPFFKIAGTKAPNAPVLNSPAMRLKTFSVLLNLYKCVHLKNKSNIILFIIKLHCIYHFAKAVCNFIDIERDQAQYFPSIKHSLAL